MRQDHPSVRGAGPLRLLVETADPCLALSDLRAFADAGFDVARCEGPGDDAGGCPALGGAGCGLAAGADVVLCDLRGPVGDAVAAALTRSSVPVVRRDPTTSVAGQVRAVRRAALEGRRQ